jgi:hypothetical protein
MCFWIRLRDVRLGNSRSPAASVLLDVLLRGVLEGRLICPISDALFLELTKQSDLQTRGATAQLIDELSCGVTLADEQTLMATEVAHLLYSRTSHPTHPLEYLVWNKVANILGVRHPIPVGCPPAEQLVIQKAFFDHTWEISLPSMLETMGNAQPLDLKYPVLAERINRENTEHAPQIRSFEQIYRDEFNAALELAAPTGYDVLHDMIVLSAGRSVEVTMAAREDAFRGVLGLLQAIGEKPIGRRALRTSHITALLHAALRWNRSQKLDANDIFDFQHAEAALGYCDVLLTDGPMKALLTQRHLGLRPEFPCEVECSIEVAAGMFD